MPRQLPVNIDELMVIAVLLIFLVINYNMPLASIYSHFAWIAIVGYLVPIIFNLFEWIPVSKKGNMLTEILVGIGSGILFIKFYDYMAVQKPMAAVFAATAFGDSAAFGKFVFGVLIPSVETILFFVIILGWILYKMGSSFSSATLTSGVVITVAVIISALFDIFHATSKGLTNTNEHAVTVVFALLSIGLVIYFKSLLPALLLHITVNGYSVKLIEALKELFFAYNTFFIIVGVAAVLYYITKKKNIHVLG